jgi:hypothetical protein
MYLLLPAALAYSRIQGGAEVVASTAALHHELRCSPEAPCGATGAVVHAACGCGWSSCSWRRCSALARFATTS